MPFGKKKRKSTLFQKISRKHKNDESQHYMKTVFEIISMVLTVSDILILSAVCKSFFTMLGSQIESKYFHPNGFSNMRVWHPTKFTIGYQAKWWIPPHTTHLSIFCTQKHLERCLMPKSRASQLCACGTPCCGIPVSLRHLSHLSFGDLFDHPVEKFPQNITHLSFGDDFNSILLSLPATLHSLIFGKRFNQPLPALPSTLSYLIFGEAYNTSLPVLPSSLTHLILGGQFDKLLTSFPPLLTHLAIKRITYRFQIPKLPPSILSLTCGKSTFNKSYGYQKLVLTHLSFDHIEQLFLPLMQTAFRAAGITSLNRYHPISLPHTITHLACGGGIHAIQELPLTITNIVFAECFNIPLPTIPSSVRTIKFSKYSNFNYPLDSLPSRLESLSLGFSFNLPIDHLPPSLVRLALGGRFNHPLDHLPVSLTHLKFRTRSDFNHPLDHLPPSLTHLSIGGGSFFTPYNSWQCLSYFGNNFTYPLDHLPPLLTHLYLGHLLDSEVNSLPHSLTHLRFGFNFNKPVNQLPPSLQHLTFGLSFNQPIYSLPTALRHLVFGDSFNQEIVQLPPSLTHLFFGEEYNLPLSYSLPLSLTHLSLGASFNHRLPELPPFLTHLTLGKSYTLSLPRLPPSLLSLTANTSLIFTPYSASYMFPDEYFFAIQPGYVELRLPVFSPTTKLFFHFFRL